MVFSLEEKHQSFATMCKQSFWKMFYGPWELLLNIVALIPTSTFGVNTSLQKSCSEEWWWQHHAASCSRAVFL